MAIGATTAAAPFWRACLTDDDAPGWPFTGAATSVRTPPRATSASGGAAAARAVGLVITSISSFISEANAEAAEGLHEPGCSGEDDAAEATALSSAMPLGVKPALKADSIGVGGPAVACPSGAVATITGLAGLGANTLASSGVSDSATQSGRPARQHSESAASSPRFHNSLTFSIASGPTCFSSMATNQSWAGAAVWAGGAVAAPSSKDAPPGCSSDSCCSGPAADPTSPAGAAWPSPGVSANRPAMIAVLRGRRRRLCVGRRMLRPTYQDDIAALLAADLDASRSNL